MPDPLAGSSILDLETALALLAVLVLVFRLLWFHREDFCGLRTARSSPRGARAETMQPASATNGCL